MANERKTIVTYKGDGTQRTFAFPFDYLRKSFIKVMFDGVVKEYGVDYTVTNKQVEFTTAPANGVVIVIYRETATDRLVAWEDASVLRASDMTLFEVQLLHLAEETQDKVQESGLAKDDYDGIWDARLTRIKNVLDPVDALDVLNRRYFESVQAGFIQASQSLVNEATNQKNQATTQAQNAATSAAKALTSESNAKASENAAKTSETNAKTSETNANTYKNNAASSATIATNKATEATTEANRSRDEANRSKTEADRSRDEANRSKVEADRAQGYMIEIQNGAGYTREVADARFAPIKRASLIGNLTNFIDYGLDYQSYTGRTLLVNGGRASMGDTVVDVNAQNINLDPRMASIVYLRKDGTIGKVNAEFPDADGNTILRYDLSSGTLADTSGNGNNLRVFGNNVEMSPTDVSAYWWWVDGWKGYGLQMDGVTGNTYLCSTAEVPALGASEREVRVVWTCVKNPPGNSDIFSFGKTGGNQSFTVQVRTDMNLYAVFASNDNNTGYTLEYGKTYFIVMNYDGRHVRLYVNGELVWISSAVTLNTLNSVFYLARWCGGSEVTPGIWHYAELKTRMSKPWEIARMANKMLIPTRYERPVMTYIDTYESGGIELRLAEAGGTTCVDQMNNRNGSIVGNVPVVETEFGGYGRRFDGNAANYISLPGSYTMGKNMTVIVVVKREQGNQGRIFGSLDTSGTFFVLSNANDFNAPLGFYNGGTYYGAQSTLPCNKVVFAAWVINPNDITFYVDSPIPEVVPATINIRTSNNLSVGRAWDGNAPFAGTLYYFLMVPRSMTQAEIARYYNKLMKGGYFNDIRTDVLPADTLSLGFVRTDVNAVREMIPGQVKHGVRIGASGGNRRVFLGWRWHGGGNRDYIWQIPFDTDKYSTRFVWRPRMEISREYEIMSYMYDDTSAERGLLEIRHDKERVQMRVHNYMGWDYDTNGGNWRTTGYVGCWVEVED